MFNLFEQINNQSLLPSQSRHGISDTQNILILLTNYAWLYMIRFIYPNNLLEQIFSDEDFHLKCTEQIHTHQITTIFIL